MIIRKAKEKDIPRIIELLGQVLQIHADIRPDIFIPGTTKYTVEELTELLKNKEKPIYVAVNESDVCVGYAFCQLQKQPFSNNMVQFKSLFIDDLCVDQQARGQQLLRSLLYVPILILLKKLKSFLAHSLLQTNLLCLFHQQTLKLLPS